jgi:hypothetical protein
MLNNPAKTLNGTALIGPFRESDHKGKHCDLVTHVIVFMSCFASVVTEVLYCNSIQVSLIKSTVHYIQTPSRYFDKGRSNSYELNSFRWYYQQVNSWQNQFSGSKLTVVYKLVTLRWYESVLNGALSEHLIWIKALIWSLDEHSISIMLGWHVTCFQRLKVAKITSRVNLGTSLCI